MTSGTRGRIAGNVLANYLGQGWAALMAIAFLPVYVAVLGLEAYGLIGFFAVLQSVLAVFDFGITSTLTREAARHGSGGRTAQSLRDLLRSFELIGAGSNTLLAMAVWFLADDLGREWIHADSLPPRAVAIAIALMGTIIAIRLQEGIYRGLLLGLERQVAVNVAQALLATLRYGGAVVVLHYGPASIVAFFVWQLGVSLASLASLVFLAYRRLPGAEQPPRFSLDSLRAVWRFSAAMTLVAGLSVVMANLDRLIVSGIVRLDEFGRYALAGAAAGVLYLLVVPVTQGFYPRFVGLLANGERATLIRMHHLCSQLVVVTCGPVAVMLAFFSMQLLYVWSGNPALAVETAPILALLAAAALANCLGHIGHMLLSASGSPAVLVATGLGAVLLSLLMLPSVAARYGVEGAALAWFGIALVQALTLLHLVHRAKVRGEGWRWLMRDIAPPLAGAVAAGWLLSRYAPAPDAGRWVLAAYLALAGAGTFAVSVLLAPEVRTRLGSVFSGRPTSAC